MPLTAQVALSILAHETSSGDLSRTLRATPANYALTLTDGTGANQAQVVWSDSRTATTVAETLNPGNLSDTRDGAAVVVAFSGIKAMYVRNTHATNTLTITSLIVSGVFPGAGQPHFVGPGGALFICTPGAGGKAASNISVLATGSGTTYDIVLIGEGTVT